MGLSLDKPKAIVIIKTERALLLAVSSISQVKMFILTVQLPLSGQYAFMVSARAKMTTNTKTFNRNLPIPASPPFQMDLLGE